MHNNSLPMHRLVYRNSWSAQRFCLDQELLAILRNGLGRGGAGMAGEAAGAEHVSWVLLALTVGRPRSTPLIRINALPPAAQRHMPCQLQKNSSHAMLQMSPTPAMNFLSFRYKFTPRSSQEHIRQISPLKLVCAFRTSKNMHTRTAPLGALLLG